MNQQAFVEQVKTWASITNEPDWLVEQADGTHTKIEPGAKPIGKAQWQDAVRVASEIVKAEPVAEFPEVGADPDGSVWLNWSKAERRFELKLSASLVGPAVQWTTVRDGMRTEHAGSSLRGVIESLRATLPRLVMQ